MILDALRRGRARTTPRAGSNAARTDAVLQTLGYGRFNRVSAFRRFRRVPGYLLLAGIFALLLWGGTFGSDRSTLRQLTPERPRRRLL
jgi:hypothetical protein